MVWREIIALDRLGVVDGHECVRARARRGRRWSVVPARRRGGLSTTIYANGSECGERGATVTSDDLAPTQ